MQSLTAKQRLGVTLVRMVSAGVFSAMGLRKRHIRVSRQEFRYGEHRDERLDYLSPQGDTIRSDTAIVYLHGGGWISCSKRFYPPDLAFLCDAGYPVFNVEYPLAPEHPHPLILQSVCSAIAWIKTQYPAIQRVHMMGDSAGANLSAMYGVLFANPELLPHIGGDFSMADLLPPQTIVSLYGLLDRGTILGDGSEEPRSVVKLFLQSYGGKAVLQVGDIAPEHAITPLDLPWRKHPPCFIGVGDVDFLFESSQRYAGELAERGIPYEHKIYPDAPHGFFNFNHAQTPALRQDVLNFLNHFG